MPATVQGAREESERGRENCQRRQHAQKRGRLGAGERRSCRRIGRPCGRAVSWVGEQCNIAPDTATSGGYRLAGGGDVYAVPAAQAFVSLAAGPGWPRRVKEQVIRTRRAHADTNPTCVLAGAPLLLGVLRQGARQSGCYEPRRIAADLQVGWQAGLPGRHRFPVRAVFSHRCGCPMAGIHIEFFLPEHSVSTCRPVRCRSYLWATSCVPARRVRAADCHHSPVRRLRVRNKRGTGRVDGNPKCKMRNLARILVGLPNSICWVSRMFLPDALRKMAGKSGQVFRARAKPRLHRSCVSGLWPVTAGKLY
jgi:hypothetical protein